ncbi:glycosyltransferase involved in cell wall biosynthesis [Actinophytocola algeriensis]|uniref:Glycosyltransferase involved in cell wall biosynthesis n=2 Tax=Actinophytocola algeriensis TaxID=1768010 RepID=A0A7W7Q7V6_9PSEU|nr:glycosyltransferase [Actinophytocola algeriensis]MBB4908468.1 glycosyltransferase involved in cell wall biosynthesis [Actinophytocola algeriensis]
MVADTPTRSEQDSPLPALAHALSVAGHEVALQVQQGPNRSKRSVTRFADVLADRWRTERPDVVHACSTFAGTAAVKAARRVGVPVVYAVDESPVTADDAAVLAAADHVFAPYGGQRPALVRAGVPRWRMSVLPYGLDVNHFTPDGAGAETRAARRIVSVGSVEPGSGFGTPVAALPALRDTELVVVGGPAHGKHAGELRAYARTLGVADRLVLAGSVPRAELPTLLRSADLVVCTPWTASFGIAAVEAMACGVAVVANAVGGLADTVVHGVTGIQVAPRRPRELAAALRAVLGKRVVREQLGASGRDRAETRYSWNFVATQAVHAYQRVLRTP